MQDDIAKTPGLVEWYERHGFQGCDPYQGCIANAAVWIFMDLTDAYEIADGFNREIDAAKKHKSTSYIAGIDTNRLIEPLAKSKQGLEE